ncbi:hypothetical protein [Bradyrhizobium sp. 170]|uniref:hypothetical protein n=1 Tax=Bradyrhizobium sp. 170 TaxID=2782641 RepID=UPI001FFF9426|nr:hypothetical protein [Bradyrhizobium sp. 170]
MIDVQRTAISIAAHAFQRARLAIDGHGQIKIIDVDGPAEDLVRVRPGDPDATRPAAERDEWLPPAQAPAQRRSRLGARLGKASTRRRRRASILPVLLAGKMCKDPPVFRIAR